MLHNRMVWTLVVLIMGVLQAWDSGVLEAGPLVQALAVVGIALPALAIARQASYGLMCAALAAGALVLVWARMVSPVSLNALHIALMVPALYILVVVRLRQAAAAAR